MVISIFASSVCALVLLESAFCCWFAIHIAVLCVSGDAYTDSVLVAIILQQDECLWPARNFTCHITSGLYSCRCLVSFLAATSVHS